MEVAPLPGIFLYIYGVLLLLVAWTGCPDTVHLFSILCSVGWGCPFLDFFVRGS
jgi:hypothetical protein